ncbi:hypothetical protein FQR65_LT18817 [Abscondita terminalis]|nr:hypothetical protein FQR65_LT18817 [Abscondita terminalis]
MHRVTIVTYSIQSESKLSSDESKAKGRACLFEPCCCAYRGDPVDQNGGEDQDTDNRLLPELVDPQGCECSGDSGEQQGAEACADHRSTAAEDCHPADDCRRDDVQFHAGSRGCPHGVEAGGVEHPGEARECAVREEGEEDAAPDFDAEEFRGVRV